MADVAVVNDEDDARELVARIIEREGHTVLRIGSVAEAVAELASGSIDLAVLDLHAGGPAVNRTLLAELRSGGNHLRAVLVGRSAGAGLLAWQGGADGYLVRPFHADDLRGVVADTLARPDAEREDHRRSAIAAIAAS